MRTKEEVIKELESLGFIDEMYDDLIVHTPFMYKALPIAMPNVNNDNYGYRIVFYSNEEFFKFVWESANDTFRWIDNDKKSNPIEGLDIPSMILLYGNT